MIGMRGSNSMQGPGVKVWRFSQSAIIVLYYLLLQVRPHVDADLMRLWSDTECRQARLKGEDEDINIQKPLYQLNTFSSNKVTMPYN